MASVLVTRHRPKLSFRGRANALCKAQRSLGGGGRRGLPATEEGGNVLESSCREDTSINLIVCPSDRPLSLRDFSFIAWDLEYWRFLARPAPQVGPSPGGSGGPLHAPQPSKRGLARRYRYVRAREVKVMWAQEGSEWGRGDLC